MRERILELLGVVAVISVVLLVSVSGQAPRIQGQTPTAAAKAGPVAKTSWGEPDLQGIWAPDFQVPLQRPAKFAGKEFFTDAEIAELDKQRASIPRRELRAERGTEADVAGAYNASFQSVRHTGRRTSLIVDPPDGKIPPFTPEAQKRRAELREFQLMLLQATSACKNQTPVCAGGKYGPVSSRYNDPSPFYNTGGLNRANGPEDRSLGERCMAAVIPDFFLGQSWGTRQIVQSPGSVSIFNDVGQGQGFHRVIPVDGSPHLPSDIRQWWGDSRGHWEGNTLVVDVTNFDAKTDFQGSRENLHLIERWTRIDANTVDYVVTIEDPTTWTKPWTARQEFNRQSAQANRIYKEPRCHEGNGGMIGMLAGPRAMEAAFAEGRGPDPATTGGAGGGLGGEENQDILQ
jgi:hypothetical protein